MSFEVFNVFPDANEKNPPKDISVHLQFPENGDAPYALLSQRNDKTDLNVIRIAPSQLGEVIAHLESLHNEGKS